MTARLIAAWPLERYQLWLAYADGTEGAVDLEDQLTPWAIEPLRDLREFRRLTLDRSQNRLAWPSGIALDTTALYRELKLRKRSTRAGLS
jgi:hypothetical protein